MSETQLPAGAGVGVVVGPRSRWSEWLGVAVVSGLVAVLFWPGWALVPHAGLDSGWQFGLSWAANLGLEWGPDIVFTYGPLGFLTNPMAISRAQVLLASAVHLSAAVVAVASAYYIARSHVGLAPRPALAVAGVVAAITLMWVAVFGATFLASAFGALVVASVAVLLSRSWPAIIALGLGLGLVSHMKLSEAAMLIGFASICAAGARGLRGFLTLGITVGLAALGLWIVVGQPLENVPTWMQNAAEVILGYAAAMGLETLGWKWHYAVAIALALLTLGYAWLVSRRLSGRAGWALLLAVLWMLWLAGRAGFTRHDGHVQIFLASVVVLAVVLMLVGGRRTNPTAGVVIVLVALTMMGTVGMPALAPIDRSGSLRALDNTLRVLESDAYRAQILASAKASLATAYPGITPEIRSALGTVEADADPWDVTAIWGATSAGWQPLPTMQTYSAYTPALDRLNRDSVVDDPRYVLRNVPTPWIDGRNPAWDSPGYQRQLYCRYRVAERSETWLLLHEDEHDRCGDIRPLATIESDAGDPVVVPHRPGEMTLVTIEPRLTLLDRVVSLLFKPRIQNIGYGPVAWRYAHGSRANRLMLNTPVAHPAFDSLPLDPYETISLSHPATITFETMMVDLDA